MTFNKTILNINKHRARCIDLYDEGDSVEIKLQDFEKLIKSWKNYVSKEKYGTMSIVFE